jgi:hypothetical protein
MKPSPNDHHQAKHRDHYTKRVAFVMGTTAILLILRVVDPVSVGKWLPFHTSCGAATGLPCIFCGMTRAIHLFLNGDFSGALYFNWLVFPFLGTVAFLVLLCITEVARRRVILNWNTVVPITCRKLTIIGLGLFLLWTLQIYLAVSQHKHELLNPRGPLYALFVR